MQLRSVFLFGAGAVLTLCAILLTRPHAPCDNFAATGLDARSYNAFAKQLHAALAAKDVAFVAQAVDYPITTHIGGKKTKLVDAAALTHHFDAIFSPEFIQKLQANNADQTVCRYDGLGWSNGLLWINAPGNNGMKIIAINNAPDV